jgi:hypothetical protein
MAYTTTVDGVSDQKLPVWDGGFSGSSFASFFANTWVGNGHIRLSRFVVQWDTIHGPNNSQYNYYRERFKEWVEDAGGMGLTLDLSITSYSEGTYPASSSEYQTRIKELLNQAKVLGHPISYLEAWNEPNNQGRMYEETELHNFTAAAHYANSANSACKEEGNACTVIAGDVEDNSTGKAYEEKYRGALNFTPVIWGVHPYYSVEQFKTSYYTSVKEGLPNKGSGDQVWITEVAARKCTDYNGNLVEHGEQGQEERAQWLVNTLMPYGQFEHVFYYDFLPGEHKPASCANNTEQDEGDWLYAPSGGEPGVEDRPTAAASFIWNDHNSPWAYTTFATVAQQTTLVGRVYPSGYLTAKYHFEYGTSTSYGSTTSEGSAGSGFGSGIEVSAKISGLTPGIIYHYRLVASNSEGVDYGLDKTFATESPHNLLTNASFLSLPNVCAGEPPSGWFVWPPEGGTENACVYENPSRSEQGSKYEEFNGSIPGGSVGQNVAVAPQVGQNYTFSVWVRAPEGEPTGQVSVFGLGSEKIDSVSTTFAANGKWQLVSVPLMVTQPKETSIRVQVYETTANKSIDLDGAQLH